MADSATTHYRTVARPAPLLWVPGAIPHVAFRADIEGLRGICVLAVVAYHSFPRAVPGGFVGVDVFFVISGFLITQLLVREAQATGRIDLVAFWARRIRRILPAAIFVLCAAAIIACMLPSVDTRPMGRHVIAAVMSYYNWRLAVRGVDYLAQDDRDNPVLHYWSLAVEEQFYMVWPALLLALVVWGGRWVDRYRVVFLATAMLAAVSFVWSLSLTASAPSYAFFGTPTRAWQLLAGALIALLPLTRLRYPGAVAKVSAGALLASFLAITDAAPYPGIAALVPTVAAAGLLLSGTALPGLAWPGLCYVGRISFSWYLWHWPLMVFFGATVIGLSAAIVASFAAAALTYALVEQPVRTSTTLRRSPVATYALGAVLLAFGAGTGFALKHFGPDAVYLGEGRWLSRAAIAKDLPTIYADLCLLRFDDVVQPACIYGAVNGTKTVVLFGDSHAANWFTPLDIVAREHGWRLLVRIKAACSPVEGATMSRGWNRTPYPECEAWRRQAIAEIAGLRPDLIIVASATRSTVAAETDVLNRLAGSPLVVMRGTPVLPENPLRCLAEGSSPERCVWPVAPAVYGRYPATSQEQMPRGARIVDLNHAVCPAGTCRAVTGARVLMVDNQHLTASFSATLAGALGATLTPNGAPANE